MDEYEACISRMEAFRELRVKEAKVFRDSTLFIAQAQKLWKVKKEHLKPYQQYLEDLTKTFDKIEYTIIPTAQNQFADALATLVYMVEIHEGVWSRPLEMKQSYEEVHKGMTRALVMTIEEEELLWYYDIMKFLELGAYPDDVDKRESHSIRMMAAKYIICGGQLYRRSYDGNKSFTCKVGLSQLNQANFHPTRLFYANSIHLHCLKKEEAKKVMKEVHQGICCPHMNGRMLDRKILRIGYYWNMMETDCVDYVKSCHDCQTHTNLNHVPPSELYSGTSPWPFLVWGIDVNGRIAPKPSNRHECILMAIGYFTKWMEVASYSVLKAKHVARFFENNIICEVRRIMEEYSIEHHTSSPCRPQAKGDIEVANKNVKNILAKMVVTYKDWAEKLPFALWGYRTSICALTGTTPYPLVYDEKMARAQYQSQGHLKRIARAFNKKVKLRNLKEGDLVLKVLRDENFDPKGTMKPRWSGPFIIKKIMSRGAMRVTDFDGKEILHPINMDRLWKYNI
ncbi:uncharacterized protein LOC142635097 [Castanea sativa]|uniref:uncharacterized protein LOC142635097 n=1 Tax=Castanea sativa TaxID=21020 RepID=UPI003F64E5FF